jgi:hypothetical protein
MSTPDSFPWFSRFGVELEYMIVDRDSLEVRPDADRLLQQEGGSYEDVTRTPIEWSNELALHVIELKTNGPAPGLAGLAEAFHAGVTQINHLLAPLDGRLMPGAAHPWMNPLTETRLWPHGQDEIYAAYDRIFHCQGHGWSNLQSVHINLPFANDDEFARLHAAIRLVLPLLPALAASSPFLDARATGLLDARMDTYRRNSARIPSSTGDVIPEPVIDRAQYQREILEPMYRDIAPFDPDGLLQEEWLNSRGAIARFDRNAIEIRVLDVQECPLADIAVVAAAVAVVRGLFEGRGAPLADQLAVPTRALAELLSRVISTGERTPVECPTLLRALNYPGEQALTVGELWAWLLAEFSPVTDAPLRQALQVILQEGPLARRLLQAAGTDVSRASLQPLYARLCRCLEENRQLRT